MTPRTYVRTDRKFRTNNPAGQQALVYERFTQGACTIKEIVEHLDSHPKFKTVQSSERIAAYYICVLKKSGHIVEQATEPVVEFNPDVEAWLAGDTDR